MRFIPAFQQWEMDAQSTGEVYICFLEISHPQLYNNENGENVIVRLVSDTVNYDYLGYTWQALPFNIGLVTDDDGPPRASLQVQNVDRKIWELIEKIDTPLSVSFFVTSASYFNNARPKAPKIDPVPILYTALDLDWIGLSVNPANVDGSLEAYNRAQEPYPNKPIKQVFFPGLFV
jgi:hypothetical protein